MSDSSFRISGQVVDIPSRHVYPGEVIVEEGLITGIVPGQSAPSVFIMPGFIDAHVHIESSMLVPSEFARLAVVHGTVATVSDPHEIANVLGIPGVEFMIANGEKVPFKFHFGAPSCVPATNFETAGARLGTADMDMLMGRKEILYLAEMMNWPGVVNGDTEVMDKLAVARNHKKPIDGHAPGLNRVQAEAYARAGITTDHECVGFDEARHKLDLGMKIIIREGSAARNFEALVDLLPEFEDRVMFCSDDKHPDSLVDGHINQLVRRAVAKGIDPFRVLKAACINPIIHYGLGVGRLMVGDPADMIVVKDLASFEILKTYVNGNLVAENGQTRIKSVRADAPNKFHSRTIDPSQFHVKAGEGRMRVIVAQDGQLITRSEFLPCKSKGGLAVADMDHDILKIAVINRYTEVPPATAFIQGFGLNEGAIASSVAHDSHNIVVVGSDDVSIATAVNALMNCKGGIVTVKDGRTTLLPLPVAGLMSNADGYLVAREYQHLDQTAKSMGSKLGAPFMTMSFMALLVIPELKLSDKGLFDGLKFDFARLFE